MTTLYHLIDRYVAITQNQLLLVGRQMGLVIDAPRYNGTHQQEERAAHRIVGPYADTIRQAVTGDVRVGLVLEHYSVLNGELQAGYQCLVQACTPFVEEECNELFKLNPTLSKDVTTLFLSGCSHEEFVQYLERIQQAHFFSGQANRLWKLWQTVKDLAAIFQTIATITARFREGATRKGDINLLLQNIHSELLKAMKVLVNQLQTLTRLNFLTLPSMGSKARSLINHAYASWSRIFVSQEDSERYQLIAYLQRLPEDYGFLFTASHDLSVSATPLRVSIQDTSRIIHFRAVHQDSLARTAFMGPEDRPDFSITFKPATDNLSMTAELSFNLKSIKHFYKVFHTALQQSADLHAKQGLLRLLLNQLSQLVPKEALKIYRPLHALILKTLQADANALERDVASSRQVLAELLVISQDVLAQHLPWNESAPKLSKSLAVIHAKVIPVNHLLALLKPTLKQTIRQTFKLEQKTAKIIARIFPTITSTSNTLPEPSVALWLKHLLADLHSSDVVKCLHADAQLRALLVLNDDVDNEHFKKFIVDRRVYETLYRIILTDEALCVRLFKALGHEAQTAFADSLNWLFTEAYPVADFSELVRLATTYPVLHSLLPNFLHRKVVLMDFFADCRAEMSTSREYDWLQRVMNLFGQLPNDGALQSLFITSMIDSFSAKSFFKRLTTELELPSVERKSQARALVVLCLQHTSDPMLTAQLRTLGANVEITDLSECISWHFEDSTTLSAYLTVNHPTQSPITKLQRLWKDCGEDPLLKERLLMRLNSCFQHALKVGGNLSGEQPLLQAELLAFILACSQSFKENNSKILLKQSISTIMNNRELKNRFLVENALFTPEATRCFSLKPKSVLERAAEEAEMDSYFSECQRQLISNNVSQSPVAAEDTKQLSANPLWDDISTQLSHEASSIRQPSTLPNSPSEGLTPLGEPVCSAVGPMPSLDLPGPMLRSSDLQVRERSLTFSRG